MVASMIVESLGGSPTRRGPQQLVLSAEDSRAVCQAIVASESRKAAVGVAECLVRIKELDSTASVELKRLGEIGATERCRIVQDGLSTRSSKWADVAQVSAQEEAKTQRLAVEARRDVAREAVAAQARVEMLKADRGFLPRSLASGGLLLLGLAAGTARTASSSVRLARSAASRVLRAALLVFVLWFAARRAEIVPAIWPWETRRVLALAARACMGIWRLRSSAPSAGTQLPQAPSLSGLAEVMRADAAEEGAGSQRLEASEAATPGSGPATSESENPETTPLPTLPPQPEDNEQADARAAISGKLSPWGLAAYAGVLAEKGYDAEVLALLTTTEAEQMFETIQCKPGHRVRFRRFLESQACQA